jgi:type II secretory pathway pseudopilin PulG
VSRGFTIIEMAVLLTVLSLLGALIVGAAGDVLDRSRMIQARDEVAEIGRSIAEFYVDTGFFPSSRDVVGGRPGSERLGVLISSAPLPDATNAARYWVTSRADDMAAHLTTNERAYTPHTPGASHSWKGPYLSRVATADPWGSAYLINVFYLDGDVAVRDVSGEPLGAVFVLSAGPNGVVETPYFQAREEALLYGDDVGYRLR